MKQYQVNSFDVCTQGFERLRSNSEFLLVACISAEVTFEVLKADLLAEISACDRPDGFDYPRAFGDLSAWLEDNVKPHFDENPNPYDLETVDYGDEDCPVNFFLYVQETELETASAE